MSDADDVHVYAVLAGDPTTEAVISWIDDRDENDRHEDQTLHYGTDPDNLEKSVEVTGDDVPEGGDALHFEAEIDSLESDTEYYGEIRCSFGEDVEVLPFKTFPETLAGEESITVAVTSDLHINEGSGIIMDHPDYMEPIADEEPDLLLLPGDVVTWGDDVDSDNTESWVEFFDEYIGTLNDGHLVPIFMVPGNHEVGGSHHDGSSPADPDEGYFQLWFKNPRELDPMGENYGEITIGDYLQVLGLDTHSADAGDVGDWLDDAIDDSVDHIIPIHHSPMLPGGDRTEEDQDLQELLRDEWAEHFDETEQIRVNFSGHTHTRKKSIPWSLTDEQPSGDDYFEVNDDYLVESDGGVVEMGDGWRGEHYDAFDDWWLDFAEEEVQFYSIDLTTDGMEVAERDQNGNLYSYHNFPEDYDGPGDENGDTDPIADGVVKRIRIGGNWS